MGDKIRNTARDQEIKEMYLAGKNMAEVGESFSISQQRVQQILSKLEVETRNISKDADLAEKVAGLIEARTSTKNIAKELGVSVSSVKKLIKNKLPGRSLRVGERRTDPRLVLTKDKIEVLVRMRLEGRPNKEIAKAVGVDLMTVVRWVKKNRPDLLRS